MSWDEIENFLRNLVKVAFWWMLIAGVVMLLVIATGRY